jgi:hypothetical protein
MRVVSPVQKKYVKNAAESTVASAQDAEKLTDTKNMDAREAAGVDIRAFVLKTLRGGCQNAFFKESKFIDHETDLSYKEAAFFRIASREKMRTDTIIQQITRSNHPSHEIVKRQEKSRS